MPKNIRIAILVLIFGMPANALSKNLVFEGRAVAMDLALSSVAINGIIYVDILVQTSKGDKSDANFIWISLSVHGYEYDQWFSDIKSIKRFNVKPSDTREVIKYYPATDENGESIPSIKLSDTNEREVIKYYPATDENGESIPSNFPFWYILPGGKSDEIPFGRRVPYYESLDWPIMPAI